MGARRARVGHLLLIAAVAWIVQVGVMQYGDLYTGMTDHYLGLARVLVAGGGYQTYGYPYEWLTFRERLAEASVAAEAGGATLHERYSDLVEDPERLAHEYFRLPGYPFFLAFVHAVFGEPIDRHAQWVQSVIGCLVPILVFFIAGRLFRRQRVAYVAAWLCALYPPLAHASVAMEPAGLSLVGLLAGFLAYLKGLEARTVWWMSVAGILLAISVYFRPNGQFFVLWLAGLTWAVLPNLRAGLKAVCALTVVFYLGLAPWALHTHATSGAWFWGSTGTGTTLWKGTGEFANPWGTVLNDSAATVYAIEHGFASDHTIPADAWFRDEVKRFVREDPVFFVKATLRRLPFALVPPFDAGYENPHRTRGMVDYYLNREGLYPHQVLIRHPGYVLRAYWERLLVMGVGVLALLGVLVYALTDGRRRPRALLLFLAVPAYYVLLHAPTFTIARYLIPLLPFQMMALAYLAVNRWGGSRSAERSPDVAAPISPVGGPVE